MGGPCEIIVTVRPEGTPRKVEFSDLHALKDDIQSMMFLWDTNSYYVDSTSKTFIINGGRRIRFDSQGEQGNCDILYRKRNRIEVSVSGDPEGVPVIRYLIGLQEKESGNVLLVSVTDDGASWEWGNKL